MISFTVPGDPKALKRHRQTKRGFAYDPSKADKADFLAKCLQNRPATPIMGPVELNLTFYFARPKSHYRTGKFSQELRHDAPLLHTRTPDLDNLIKFVCDALNGVFWRDDSQVCAGEYLKKYSVTPRVEIVVKEISGN